MTTFSVTNQCKVPTTGLVRFGGLSASHQRRMHFFLDVFCIFIGDVTLDIHVSFLSYLSFM
jgi:hypothetical protein